MHRRPRVIVLLATVATAVSVMSPCAAAPLDAQTSEVQMVSITVTPKNLAPAAEWRFDVAMNTHVRPLDDDLAASAVLIDAQGHAHAPLAWRGDPPGGHHRRVVLVFAPIAPLPPAIELRLQCRGEDAPRTFKWTLPSR